MGLMVVTGGSRRFRRFTAQACALCYLVLALAGALHHHHHGDAGCAAGCPSHHDHCCGDPVDRIDGSTVEIGEQGDACPLCIWFSSSRVRQEIGDLSGRHLIALGIQPAEENDPVATLCFLSRQSRAPPVNVLSS